MGECRMGVGDMSRYTLVLVLTIILVCTDWVEAEPKAKTLLVETIGGKPGLKASADYGLCPGHHTCYGDYNGDYGLCPGHRTCYGDYNNNNDYKLCPGHHWCTG